MNLLLDSSFHCNDETKAFSQALFSELGDPLMFGAITVRVYDPDGEDFMINGRLTGFREQITLIVDYAPDLLTELYIAENELSLEYWDEWSEEWIEPRGLEVDYVANQITSTSYNVYAQYALFGSEFLNRPPMWEDVQDQASGREGEEIQFDLIGVDSNEDDELFIEMLSGDLPPEVRLIDYEDGTGSFNWTPSEGDEGEYLARFTLSDEEDEVVVEVQITVLPSLSVSDRESDALPVNTALLQNYPNPFNSTTSINYFLANSADVRLTVYDSAGRIAETLADGWQEAGVHHATLQGIELAEGVYILRFEGDGVIQARNVVLLK